MSIQPFDGAKLALLSRGRVLAMLRDNKPDIPYPGCWDLPGGGREGNETPEECVLRELREEFGVVMQPAQLEWRIRISPRRQGNPPTWFFAVETPELRYRHIQFGDEGQEWRLMPVRMFLMNPKSVPHLAKGLAEFLEYRRSNPA